MDLFELADALRARDAGMKAASDHAEDVKPGWNDCAYEWVRKYARTHERFISEECTAWASAQGFASPTDPRSWGAVFKRAARDGIIVRVGYGTSLRRHCSPTPLWESAVFRVYA